MSIDVDEARRLAAEELRAEQFKRAVAEEKERLRQRRPFWQRVFPFVIRIERRK